MGDLTLLGNAAAVPIIIGITQLLKKNFSFRYKADVVSALVALLVCPLWWFYNTDAVVIQDALDDGTVATMKFIIHQCVVAGATWLSATKSYDLFLGSKKRTEKHAVEKEHILSNNNALSTRIQELENGLDGGGNDELVDKGEIDGKLLEILEGR